MKDKDNRQKDSAWERDFPVVESSELALVGLLLYKQSLFPHVLPVVRASNFSNTVAKFLFAVLEKHYAKQAEWTWTSIADYISGLNKLPKGLNKTPHATLSEIVLGRSDETNLDFHLQQISNLQVRRKLLENHLPAVRELAKDPSCSFVELLKQLKTTEDLLVSTGLVQIERIATEQNAAQLFLKEMEKIKNVGYLGTGYPSIDDSFVWGFFPGMVTVIYGRPSSGKSTLRSNIQLNLGRMHIETLTISLEQSVLAEVARMVSIAYQIPLAKIIRVHDWTIEFRDELEHRLNCLQRDFRFRIVEPLTSFHTIDIKRSILEARQDNFNPRVVFVDLFAQLGDVSGASGNKPQVIEQKMIQVANIAKELQVHICLVVQQRRLGEQKKGSQEKYDVMETAKGGGGYEERADGLFLVQRPAYYDKELEDNTVLITMAKQRDGARPTISLSFYPETVTMLDDLEGLDEQDSLDHLSE